MNRFIQGLISLIIIFIGTIIAYPSQTQNIEKELESSKAINQFIKNEKRKYKSPVEVSKVITGDIDNDGKEDKLIEYDVNIGHPGNATISFIAVFLNIDGKLKYKTKIDAGAFGTATGEQLSLDKIEIYCKAYEYAPNDGVCCPSIEKSYKYKLYNGRLKRFNK